MQVDPFTIQVEESVLEDLKLRLQRTRLSNNAAFSSPLDYGQDFQFQQSLLEHWLTKYDWRAHERELNRFAHFKAQVTPKLRLHFIHERSRVPGAVPLLMLHGWPGSVWEFHECIRPLVAPEPGRALRLKQAFHVVAPSLPGFGWSQASEVQGMGAAEVARVLHRLMTGLGYGKYAVQGGDWGALVAKQIALQFPHHCVAVHLTMPLVAPPPLSLQSMTARKAALLATMLVHASPLGRMVLSPQDQQRLLQTKHYLAKGNAYFTLQTSKPNTPGFALSDSPSGLLAWISEKLQLWTDGKGNVLNALSKDEIITNVMIYWVTNTIASSMRLYKEIALDGPEVFSDYCHVPTGWASFPKEIVSFPKSWVERTHNLVHHTEFTDGGHFPAWEQPALFVQDLRQFFHRAMPWDAALELAAQREQRALAPQSPPTKQELAAKLLVFAPVLPVPAVAALASYLLLSKL